MKDIFNSKADYIVIPVNMVKVMGAGLAKQFKEKYPHIFNEYVKIKFTKDNSIFQYFHFILFATKYHWKDNSDIDLIKNGLIQLKNEIEDKQYPGNPFLKDRDKITIAFPKIGCGLGNLDWNEVKPLIIKYLGNCVNLEFYE